jgi:hypothetical protein
MIFNHAYRFTLQAVTDIACASLDDLKMGDKTLIVRRATVRLAFR